MPRRSLSQNSFFDPEFVCPGCLEAGTVPWILARFRSKLFPAWVFKGWRGEGRLGRNAWPAVVLMTLLLLRWTEVGSSRRGACRRAKTDAAWRAAMGLEFSVAPPDEKTVRDFERFLRKRHPDTGTPRYILLHEHIVRLCINAGVVGNDPTWVADSTPMWCYGAVSDTVRLLGRGVRMVARQWSEGVRVSVEAVARKWNVPWILTPSIKGAFSIDWRDAEARSGIVTELGEKAVEVVEAVRERLHTVRRGKRKKLLKLCRHLMRVVEQNLEADEAGRLSVARRVAKDRVISLTDPEARHGRKSKTGTFNGFKLHLLGDIVSGLILSLAVAPGNIHDSLPAPRLVQRAKALFESMTQLLGDTAYGGARLRYFVRRSTNVSIIAPPVAVQQRDGLSKNDFWVDIERGIAKCPNEIISDDLKYIRNNGVTKPRFRWPKESCEECPMATGCPATTVAGRPRLIFHQYETELRATREQWEAPETRQLYRLRAQGERLINEAVRRGARKASAWGLQTAALQAYNIVMVNNLRLLALTLE